MKRCPQCDEKMEHQDYDPDTNTPGGYFCEPCNEFIYDDEVADDLE